MTLRKLTTAIDMLTPFVFLSMYGLMIQIATKSTNSKTSRPTACTVPCLCPKAMNKAFASVCSKITMIKKYIVALNCTYKKPHLLRMALSENSI